MSVIYTVDFAKFTTTSGAPLGLVDLCADDEGNVHLRINNGRDDTVLVLTKIQARRVRNMIDKAIDGIVAA